MDFGQVRGFTGWPRKKRKNNIILPSFYHEKKRLPLIFEHVLVKMDFLGGNKWGMFGEDGAGVCGGYLKNVRFRNQVVTGEICEIEDREQIWDILGPVNRAVFIIPLSFHQKLLLWNRLLY